MVALLFKYALFCIICSSSLISYSNDGTDINTLDSDTLTYRYKDNVFTLELLSLNDHDFKDMSYSYMLVGVDTRWNYGTSPSHFITYSNLSCGEYVLMYKIYHHKTKTVVSKSIKIIVKPAFWQTSHFRLSVGGVLFLLLLCSAFILLLYRRRYKTQIDVEKRRVSKIEEEQKELICHNQELQERTQTTSLHNVELQNEGERLRVLNTQVETQADELHRQNQKLTSGIRYAKRIQNSLLPSVDFIRASLPNTAVFFQPKEMVSGDFYWLRSIGRYTILAEADCTGHGVSGAFMSMIGITLLNEIVVNRQVFYPSDILAMLNDELNIIFSNDQFDIEDVDEGMDITVVVYDREKKRIHIASAMQNYFVIQYGKTSVYKGDIFSIGGYISRIKKPVYSTTSLDLKDDTRIIIGSDGLFDQFGKEVNDKFGLDRFMNFLTITNHLDIQEQFTQITKYFNSWMGQQEQIDDILLVGVDFTSKS